MTLIAKKKLSKICRYSNGDFPYSSSVILEGMIKGRVFRYIFPTEINPVGELSVDATQARLLEEMQAPLRLIPRYKEYYPHKWSATAIQEHCKVRCYLELSFVEQLGIPFIPKEDFDPYQHPAGKLIPHEWVVLPEEDWRRFSYEVDRRTVLLKAYQSFNYELYLNTPKDPDESYTYDWKPSYV